MLSVVSVFNNPAKLAERLVASLDRQTAKHERFLVDNRDGRFTSAASALNHGASTATGDWLVFVHQDIELIGNDWLERAEEPLRTVDPNGWHGLVGRTTAGRWRGLLRDRAMVFGEPFETPIPVQTLDEIVLIHRNRGPGYRYFDEQITGWHAYGVEACCRAVRDGATNTVIPLPVWHDSGSTNQAGLRDAHRSVWEKHRSAFRRIYTSCGVLPHGYGRSGSYKVWWAMRALGGWRHLAWRRLPQASPPFERTPYEVLEELTKDEPRIECLHRRHRVKRLDGLAFTDRTANPRPVIHHFDGLNAAPRIEAGCVVVMPDFAGEFTKVEMLPKSAERLIVALHLGDGVATPSHWRAVFGRPLDCHLAIEPDDTRWAILDVKL